MAFEYFCTFITNISIFRLLVPYLCVRMCLLFSTSCISCAKNKILFYSHFIQELIHMWCSDSQSDTELQSGQLCRKTLFREAIVVGLLLPRVIRKQRVNKVFLSPSLKATKKTNSPLKHYFPPAGSWYPTRTAPKHSLTFSIRFQLQITNTELFALNQIIHTSESNLWTFLLLY